MVLYFSKELAEMFKHGYTTLGLKEKREGFEVALQVDFVDLVDIWEEWVEVKRGF